MECWAIAAFRPGQEVWPFGRRRPSRDGLNESAEEAGTRKAPTEAGASCETVIGRLNLW